MYDLAGLERAAYRREPDRAERLIRAVTAIVTGRLVEDAAQPVASPADLPQVATRIAAAAGSMAADPEFCFSEDEAARAFVVKGGLDNLFAISGFGSADFALRAAAAAGAPRLLEQLYFQSIDSGLDLPLERIAELPAPLAQLATAALLSTKPVMTARGQERRDRLLERAAGMSPAEVPPTSDHVVLIANAWMLCSYASTPAKHQIKRVLNHSLRGLTQKLGIAEVSAPRLPLKARPVMVVAAEIMGSHHVQYRYFGQYLRQLRTRFELVLVTDRKEVDPNVEALFDRVLTFERRAGAGHLTEIPRLIAGVEPDVIFWPSVGMRHWGPLVANLRLAPIQFTGLGHSASTFCDTIDYYLVEEGYVSTAALLSETVVLLPDQSQVFERAPAYVAVAPAIRAAANPIQIAVPSNLLKLNPNFLGLLARIRAAAGRAMDFHLFPAAGGLEAAAFEAGLRKLLPGAHRHGNMSQERYLRILSNCDLTLSPFPFGGLHSVVDSLRQGLPVVAMERPELHGRTDSMLLRRFGLPDWLVGTTEDEYVAAALRLIDDDATRVAVSRQALSLDLDNTLFGDATTPLRTEVVDAVWWFYRNHEAIQAAGRKAWGLSDRARMTLDRVPDGEPARG